MVLCINRKTENYNYNDAGVIKLNKVVALLITDNETKIRAKKLIWPKLLLYQLV